MLMREEMHNHDVISDAPWHKSAPSARGVFSAIDGQQRITWCDEVLFLIIPNYVLQDVDKMKQ